MVTVNVLFFPFFTYKDVIISKENPYTLHNTGTFFQPTQNCVELKLLFQITKGQVDNMYSYSTRVNFIKIEFKYKNDVTSTFYQKFCFLRI